MKPTWILVGTSACGIRAWMIPDVSVAVALLLTKPVIAVTLFPASIHRQGLTRGIAMHNAGFATEKYGEGIIEELKARKRLIVQYRDSDYKEISQRYGKTTKK